MSALAAAGGRLTEPGPLFDPEEPSFVRDPYGTYRALRESPKAAWSDLDGAWLITRHEDVLKVLHDHETFASDDRSAIAPGASSRSLGHLSLLAVGPPDHARLRKVVGRSFSPSEIASMRPRIEEVVDELLDRGLRDGRMDLMRHLAVPLPLIITAEMLGMDAGDQRRLQAWANDEMTAILPGTPNEERARLLRSSEEMLLYFHERARSDEPRPQGVFGRLLAAVDEGHLAYEEMLAFAALLVRAGSHTVTHLIGNSVLALLKQRHLLEQLRATPDLWPAALEELLRHSGPLHSVIRVATREATVHGRTLGPGAMVHAVLASANRDERVYPEPDRLRLDRDPGDHVAFGSGIHSCLGAALGKLQAQVALERLLDRMPLIARMEPLRDPDWVSVWAIRGLRRLPLRGGH